MNDDIITENLLNQWKDMSEGERKAFALKHNFPENLDLTDDRAVLSGAMSEAIEGLGFKIH